MRKFWMLLLVTAVGLAGWSCSEDSTDEPGNTEITVSFDSQGGTPVEPQTLKMGDRVKMPQEPTKSDGAQFQGWYTEPTGGVKFDFANYAVTEDLTLYAVWVPVYKVTFVYGNGSPDTQILVVYNGKVEKPVDPVYSGFEFKGWYASADDTAYDFDTPVTADVLLTAKWEEVSPYATVSFYQNLTDKTTKVDVQVLKGTVATVPDEICPASLVPLKWYSDEACTQEFDLEETKINASLSLWATWQLQDIDGNLYPITKLTISGQDYWWSAANLRVTHFADGSPITLGQAPPEWAGAAQEGHANYQQPLYCEVGYDYTPSEERAARTALVGMQYNWYAASSSKGLCPEGWHVPTYDEWFLMKSLKPYPYSASLSLDEEGVWEAASGKTPAEGSPAYDYTQNNLWKFNSRPSPARAVSGYYSGNNFDAKTEVRYWASTDGDGANEMGGAVQQNAHEGWLNYYLGGTGTNWSEKSQGYHVRCLKDN